MCVYMIYIYIYIYNKVDDEKVTIEHSFLQD